MRPDVHSPGVQPVLTAGVLPPFDRESFFDAQRRNRRRTWKLTLACYAAVAIVSTLIALLLSPLLLSVLVLVTDLVALIRPLPDLGLILFDFADRLIDRPETLSPLATAGGLLVAAGPALVVAAAFWIALRRLFARVGEETAVHALGARPISPLDLEEQQWRNVVEEMALAAGLAPPQVAVYDGGPANGLAVGLNPDDAVLMVSRPGLDALDRAEAQGLAAHLVGTVSNGDMRIGNLIVSVLQLAGLVRLLTLAPAEAHAREVLWRLLKYAVRPEAEDPRAAEELMTELVDVATMDDRMSEPRKHEPVTLTWRDWLRMPLMPAVLVGGVMLPMLTMFLLMPLFAFGWRARRRLADATAVQLTRQPDALAGALVRIRETGTATPGPRWLRHLYVASHDGSSIVSFHPPLEKRVNAIRRMGASLGYELPGYSAKELLVVYGVVLPLSVIAGGLMLVALYLMALLSVMLSMFFLLPVVALLHALLRGYFFT